MHQKRNERVVDLDPRETAEWIEALDQVIDEAGPDRAAYLLEELADRARGPGRRPPQPSKYPLHQYDPSRRRAALPGRPRHGAAHQEPHPLERHGHGGAPEQVRSAASAATFPRMPRWQRCWKWASTISFTPSYGDQPGDLVYFQGHASPGVYARAFLEGRLTEEHLKNFRHELREHPGLSVLPASLADAGFLEFPDGLHGARADQCHLPGALHALPGKPRPDSHHAAARSGRFWAMARWTSRNPWARSPWRRAKGSTT